MGTPPSSPGSTLSISSHPTEYEHGPAHDSMHHNNPPKRRRVSNGTGFGHQVNDNQIHGIPAEVAQGEGTRDQPITLSTPSPEPCAPLDTPPLLARIMDIKNILCPSAMMGGLIYCRLCRYVAQMVYLRTMALNAGSIILYSIRRL